jgi:hypothetical protein
MSTFNQAIWMALLSTIFALPVQASDSAREQRWANQITDFQVTGKTHWFEAGGQKFIGLYTPAVNQKPVGAVILLHSRGVHPDWPQVIQPLRKQLPSQGWATLSLQMPVMQDDASDEDYLPVFKDVPARIQAGLNFLKKQGINNIVLIGHGLGSNMATVYLANNHDPIIKAFVGIDMMGSPKPEKYQVLDNMAAMARMTVPVLDIYGSQTYPTVLESTYRRAIVVYLTGHGHSRQIEIDKANHFFQGHEDELLQSISDWLVNFADLNQDNKLLSSTDAIHAK